MNTNNSAGTSSRTKQQTSAMYSVTNEPQTILRYTKCMKCGKERASESTGCESTSNNTGSTASPSMVIPIVTKPEADCTNSQDMFAATKETNSKTDQKYARKSAVHRNVIVKHHRKIQVDLSHVKHDSKSVQVNILSDLNWDKSSINEREDKSKSIQRRKSSRSRDEKKANTALLDTTNNNGGTTVHVPQPPASAKVNENVVCCRCSLEVYKRRQEFNTELEVMKSNIEKMKLQHKKEIDRFEELCKKRKSELSSEIDSLLEKRKEAMTPVQLKQLEKESELLQKHGELNKLEEKLLDRIQSMSERQGAVEDVEKDLTEQEGRIERRQNILSTRQLLTQNMSQDDFTEEALKEDKPQVGKVVRAQTNWELVRNEFRDQSNTLKHTLNNCKVQLAASQNKEMELQKELNEYRQKVKEMEHSSIQKDKKIKDLQDRLTTLIKQTLPMPSNRKKSISIDEAPNRIQGDNQSNQFVYYSKQRKHSITPSYDEALRGANGLGHVRMN